MIYKLKNHTSLTKAHGAVFMENIFNFIRIIYYYNESTTSILHKHKVYMNEDNYHVIILTEDDWRNGHGHRSNNINFTLKYDINLLNDNENQELLNKFIEVFLLNSHQNKLSSLFYNAIKLFNRAIKYETEYPEVYILLMMTTAEILLTQNRNEKRLRLSAIIPRIIEHNEISNVQLSETIQKLYLERNKFVHAGLTELSEVKKHSKLLAQIISKLIVFYFTFIEEITSDNQENQLNQWEKYVNEIFENIILGVDIEGDI